MHRTLFSGKLRGKGCILGLGAQARGFREIGTANIDPGDDAIRTDPGDNLDFAAISLGRSLANIADYLIACLGDKQGTAIIQLQFLKGFHSRHNQFPGLFLCNNGLLADRLHGNLIGQGKPKCSCHGDNCQDNPC